MRLSVLKCMFKDVRKIDKLGISSSVSSLSFQLTADHQAREPETQFLEVPFPSQMCLVASFLSPSSISSSSPGPPSCTPPPPPQSHSARPPWSPCGNPQVGNTLGEVKGRGGDMKGRSGDV